MTSEGRVLATSTTGVSPGVVVDYDTEGRIAGIDIENAGKVVNLTRLEADALPLTGMAISAA